MKSCWAAHLGDCSQKITGEHIVSKGLIEADVLEVFGLPWLNGEKKVIGLSSLTRKILCEKHNNQLSTVDTAAKKAFFTFRDMGHAVTVPAKLESAINAVENYEINGVSLERWLLKTLINIMYKNFYPIGNARAKPGTPSDELVEIAFGRKAFQLGRGLYVIYSNMKLSPVGRIEFTPIMKNDKSYVAGAVFSFGGPIFFLFCGNEEPPQHLEGIMLGEFDLSNSELFYRPGNMELLHMGNIFQKVRINW